MQLTITTTAVSLGSGTQECLAPFSATQQPLTRLCPTLYLLHSLSFCEVTTHMVEITWYLSTSDWFHLTSVSSVIRVVTNHRISLLNDRTTFPSLISCWMLQLFPCLPVGIALQRAGVQGQTRTDVSWTYRFIFLHIHPGANFLNYTTVYL